MARTRSKTSKKKTQAEAHLEKMREYRENEEYKDNENKAKVFRRIMKGSIPHVSTLAKYDIKLTELNDLRRQNGFTEISYLRIPYYLRARERNVAEGLMGDDLPEASVQFGGFPQEEGENEVTSRSRPQEIRSTAEEDEDERPVISLVKHPKYSVADISLWMRKNPGQATQKRKDDKADTTISRQFGDNRNPLWNKAGQFYQFMKLIGEEYVDDVRKVVRSKADMDKAVSVVETPQKTIGGANKRSGEFKKLEVMIQYFQTLVIALRRYPGFDALNNSTYQRQYEYLDRKYVLLEARNAAEKFANPKEQLPVERFSTIFSKITKKYKKGTKEHLYIHMYKEFPSRDDFKALFVNANETSKMFDPKSEVDFDNTLQNTLFVRSEIKRVAIVLVRYKTVALYGKRYFEFSEATSNLIKQYIKDNNIGKKNPFLFGKGSMSKFVEETLDSIGLPKSPAREGHINYLRKSFVSSQLAELEKASADDRINLAFHMKHSPSASLKYVRELVKEVPSLDELPKEQLENARKFDAQDISKAGRTF
jgi:hypothetical protein